MFIKEENKERYAGLLMSGEFASCLNLMKTNDEPLLKSLQKKEGEFVWYFCLYNKNWRKFFQRM